MLDDLFSRVQELPTIPKVVQELIQSFNNDDFDIDDLAKKIGMDQVLTAKVLRLANSARYGGHRSVSSVNEAIMRMGFNALRTLVLACGFTSTFKAPEGFDLKRFWHHSFAVAELSRWVAAHSSVDAEVAFTSGMLSNIGHLMAHLMMPEKALEIDRVVEKGGNRTTLENDAWGFTSNDAGAKLAQTWMFPEPIVDGIKYQDEPLTAPDNAPLACVIHIANYVQHGLEAGQSDEDIIAAFPNEVASAAGVDLAGLLDTLSTVRELDSGIDQLLD